MDTVNINGSVSISTAPPVIDLYPDVASKSGELSTLRKAVVGMKVAFNILGNAWNRNRNLTDAFKSTMKVLDRRKTYKTDYQKLRFVNGRYFQNLHIPGWPSSAFDRYTNHLMNITEEEPQASLFALVFAITNKCGFQCQHCVEWENLNRKDTLSRYDLLSVIEQFHDLGVSQVQLSGGEPLNRFEDIIYLLDNAPPGIDFWLYSNGYQLNGIKARELKEHGLTGILLSLDHVDPEKHDAFRGVKGSFERVMRAAEHVNENGLVLAFSCCATNDFITPEHLHAYARLTSDAGATFIQFLEPEAAGRYAGMPVELTPQKQQCLEAFYMDMNYGAAYRDYPIVNYPDWIKRFAECPGKGIHFVYVNADGQVQACPFCRKSYFHALEDDLPAKIKALRGSACAGLDWWQRIESNSRILSSTSGGTVPMTPAEQTLILPS